MRKPMIIIFVLLVFCLSSCNKAYEGEIEYPIELEKQIQNILYDEDGWDCENEVCTTIFEEIYVVNAFTVEENNSDITHIVITSDFLSDIVRITYFPETNLWRVMTYSRDVSFTCDFTETRLNCDTENYPIDDELSESLLEFRENLLGIIYPYTK